MNAAMPASMTPISATLDRTTIVRLLTRSASQPANPENSTKGSANAPCANIWGSFSSPN